MLLEKIEEAMDSGFMWEHQQYSIVINQGGHKQMDEKIWKSPPENWLKVNVDSSWKNYMFTIIGIVRDYRRICKCT